ncbi:hypothetical protein NPIL_392471 [Nephila pilipes]|uniref:Uncharacterized protein n=1 Tax=Nephila pilipes TaxID=299642 RepID=A0A8X6TCL2_NEPPI|nr:hypothetical protein NPIL_392471 [Nephila pilipes]
MKIRDENSLREFTCVRQPLSLYGDKSNCAQQPRAVQPADGSDFPSTVLMHAHSTVCAAIFYRAVLRPASCAVFCVGAMASPAYIGYQRRRGISSVLLYSR